MNKDLHWYGFSTDHDFAYLHRILSGLPVPTTENQFLTDLSLLFPNIYDIKVLADRSFGVYRGSLSYLCDKLNVNRMDE